VEVLSTELQLLTLHMPDPYQLILVLLPFHHNRPLLPDYNDENARDYTHEDQVSYNKHQERGFLPLAATVGTLEV